MAQIKHKDTGKILYELDGEDLRETLLSAVRDNIYLEGVDLQGA